MIEIIKVGTLSFICCKSLKCFGKKDYSDVIALVSWLYVGSMVIMRVGGWYNSFMDSRFIEVITWIFG